MLDEPTIPLGLCQCGCGKPSGVMGQTIPRIGWKKGYPKHFIRGHNRGNTMPFQERVRRLDEHRAKWSEAGVSYGLCLCGCGRPTRVSRDTSKSRGWISGEPRLWVLHHDKCHSADRYLAEDRGHDTPCWIWQRSLDPAGYGKFSKGLAHRAYYEIYVGPIPDGLSIDHLCSQKACVNPSHLEAVTQQENCRRAVERKRKRLELGISAK